MKASPPITQKKSPPLCSCRRGTFYLGVIAGTVGIMIVAVAGVTALMPKKFESRAVIQIFPIRHIGDSETLPIAQSRQLFPNNLEAIRSQSALKIVAQKLNLAAQWGMTEQEVLTTLRTMIHAPNISGTDLFEIRVTYSNPQDAHQVTTALLENYQSRREDEARQAVVEGIKELENAIQEQTDRVEEKHKTRDNLLRRFPDSLNPSTASKNFSDSIQAKRMTLEQEWENTTTALQEIDALIKTIDSLNPQDAIHYVASLESTEQDFKSLYQEYQRQQRTWEGMMIHENHPDLLKQKNQVEANSKLLIAKLELFKASLKLNRNRQASVLEDLKTRLSELKGVAVTQIIGFTTIQGVQRELELEQKMLEMMFEKLTKERIKAQQRVRVIELHEEPIVASSPSSPNWALHLLMGTACGLILGIMIAIWMKIFHSRCEACSLQATSHNA